jgi:hypothetical protein
MVSSSGSSGNVKKIAKNKLDEPISPNKKALDDWIENGGIVKSFSPYERNPWPDKKLHGGDGNLGLTPEFQAQTGNIFLFEKGSTPGGRILNEGLKSFGYYGKTDGGENSDGDHILEAQLVGSSRANVIKNMWPLAKSENRHGEHLLKTDIEIPGKKNAKEKTLEEASVSSDPNREDRIWVMIKNTRSD